MSAVLRPRDRGPSEAACCPRISSWDGLGAAAARSTAADLDGNRDHERLAAAHLPASAQPELLAADERPVDLDRAFEQLAVGIDHRAPELVKDEPGGLAAAKAEHVLKLDRRESRLVRRHRVGGRRMDSPGYASPEVSRGPKPRPGTGTRRDHGGPTIRGLARSKTPSGDWYATRNAPFGGFHAHVQCGSELRTGLMT